MWDKKLYRLQDEKRRCSACRYTFHDFTGRWINQGNLIAGQWLRLIKLFELELSARKIAQQLGLSDDSVYKAIRTIRSAILAHSKDREEVIVCDEVEVDESHFGGKRKGKHGRGATGKAPVFGILEREERVFVEVIPTTRAKDVLALTVKKVRRGSIVYTDRYQVYDTLMICGYLHLRRGPREILLPRSRIHQRAGGILELCQGTHYEIPWRLPGEVPLLPQGTGVPIQSSQGGPLSVDHEVPV